MGVAVGSDTVLGGGSVGDDVGGRRQGGRVVVQMVLSDGGSGAKVRGGSDGG